HRPNPPRSRDPQAPARRGAVVGKRPDVDAAAHRLAHPQVRGQTADRADALRLGSQVAPAQVRADLVADHVAQGVVRQVERVRHHVLVGGQDARVVRAEVLR
ncbi:MAG: hypothetical protein ACK559_37475, partial [bacterium]